MLAVPAAFHFDERLSIIKLVTSSAQFNDGSLIRRRCRYGMKNAPCVSDTVPWIGTMPSKLNSSEPIASSNRSMAWAG
jgi:hypothetical protein